nr:MAG TPA: hypothetical protein [Caudoviricetes sp.]DAY07539.1 MAG TPA: hypothetical protein [Caudoviricetes sp.]
MIIRYLTKTSEGNNQLLDHYLHKINRKII